MKLKKVFFSSLTTLLLFGLLPSRSEAAAFPGESLSRPSSGLFWLSQGFRLGTEGTAWIIDEKPKTTVETFLSESTSAKTALEGATYSLVAFPSARLRIETEDLKVKSTLESYTKRWVKEYFQYGFKILSTKPMKLNGHPTIVYDLMSRAKDVQIRQIIQVHNGKAIVITCSDKKDSFQKSVAHCNRMAQNLAWATPLKIEVPIANRAQSPAPRKAERVENPKTIR